VCRVEKKERARLKSVKFYGRSADAKGVSTVIQYEFLLIVAINNFSFAVPNGQYKCQLVLKGGVAF